MSMPEMEQLPAVLTVMEVAAVLRIGRNSAYRFVKTHQIRSFRIGHAIRIPREAVEEYLKSAR